MPGLNKFNTTFEKYEGFSIRQLKATLLVITKLTYKLLEPPESMHTSDVQETVKLLFQFANTSPEKCNSHWTYISATLLDCPAMRL